MLYILWLFVTVRNTHMIMSLVYKTPTAIQPKLLFGTAMGEDLTHRYAYHQSLDYYAHSFIIAFHVHTSFIKYSNFLTMTYSFRVQC